MGESTVDEEIEGLKAMGRGPQLVLVSAMLERAKAMPKGHPDRKKLLLAAKWLLDLPSDPNSETLPILSSSGAPFVPTGSRLER